MRLGSYQTSFPSPLTNQPLRSLESLACSLLNFRILAGGARNLTLPRDFYEFGSNCSSHLASNQLHVKSWKMGLEFSYVPQMDQYLVNNCLHETLLNQNANVINKDIVGGENIMSPTSFAFLILIPTHHFLKYFIIFIYKRECGIRWGSTGCEDESF